MGSIYIYSIISMGGIALILGLGLAYSSRVFKVEEDESIEKIDEILPGANCGACGYAGCRSFAEALAKGEADVDGCPVGGDAVTDKIAEILGKENTSSDSEVAQILCNGGTTKTKKNAKYQGIKSCEAVKTINGFETACEYGCIGFGDCEVICPFDAIEMNKDSIPEIDYDRCTGCGKCVDVCPQDILVLASDSSQNHIRCNSHDIGRVVKEICEVGCIGCGICIRTCPVAAISLDKNLAVIDYDQCVNCGLCAQKCPVNTIHFEDEMIKDINITENCVGCTRCAQECPVEAISGEVKEKHQIDAQSCIKCGICAEVCSVEGAIAVEYEDK